MVGVRLQDGKFRLMMLQYYAGVIALLFVQDHVSKSIDARAGASPLAVLRIAEQSCGERRSYIPVSNNAFIDVTR